MILFQEMRSQTCTLVINYTPPTAFSVCDASASVTFTGSPNNTLFCPPTYTWIPGFYTSSNINNVCAGTYTVYAYFGGGPTCCGTTTGVVIIPNGPTSIHDLNRNEELIFFNRTTSVIQFKNINRNDLSIKIIDIVGKEVRSVKLDEDLHEISVQELQTGFYFIVLYSDKEIIAKQTIHRF